MIRTAFCDDNPDVINQIDALLPDMKLGTAIVWDMFGSGEELLSHIQRTEEPYNIYVLDIETPELNGIETAGRIRMPLGISKRRKLCSSSR